MTGKIKIATMVSLVLILLTTAFGIGHRVGAASNTPGSMSDPLITQSYLEQVLSNYTGSTAFTCQTIKNGQTQSFKQGSVLVLYSGGATATATLIDLTTGTALNSNEKLVKYHEYLIPSDDSGIKTTSLSVIFIQE